MARFVLPVLVFFSCFFNYAQEVKDTLKVGYTNAAPFIIEEQGELQGINVWLWTRVAEDLGLPYELHRMDFPEMLEGLTSGAVDVSINPLTITSERSKEFEFTDSFYASHSVIVVAKQTSWQKIKGFLSSFFQANFIRGFLALFGLLLFFGILVWLFERKKNPEHFRRNHKGLWDGLWWSVVTLTTVGYGDKAPQTRLGKVTALLLMFSGLLFVSGLTASIASSLTVGQLASESSNFEDFKEKNVGTIKNSGAEDFLKGHFFKSVSTFGGVQPGLTALRDNELDAFIYDSPIVRYRMKRDSTFQNLEVLPQKFDVQFYAFGLKHNSTALEKKISQRILEIMETQEWQVILSEYGLSEL
ncbi:MAG: transporter substrate-binding domain-containing protein [Bacteroidota bacterium]